MSDLHPLSGAYAVDALDDLERVRFERHLVECPECAAEVSSLVETAALLAASVEAGPTPAMRSRVLSEISTIRPLPPLAPEQGVARRTTRWFPKVLAASAAAVLLATGVGVSAWHPWRPDQTSQVSAESRVLDAADRAQQTIDLPGGGEATVVHSRAVGKAVLVTRQMPKAPNGKVYELWFKDVGGTMIPAGLMTGGGDDTVVLKGRLADSTGVGITVEPAGGSASPTTRPVASFDLRKST